MDALREMGVSLEGRESVLYAESAVRLTDRETMMNFLDVYAPYIKALDRVTAAVYFCNRFASVCLSLQYMLSIRGCSLDFSLERLTVQLFKDEDRYAMAFQLDEWIETREPALEGRNEWIRRVYSDFYSRTVKPIYEAAAEAAGIPVGQLWGLLPTRFNFMTEQWGMNADYASRHRQIADDYAYLCGQLEASVFNRAKNPFDVQIRWIEHLREPGKQMRMKNACCCYYRTEGGDYCYSCPRLKESEREQRRVEARKTAVAAN